MVKLSLIARFSLVILTSVLIMPGDLYEFLPALAAAPALAAGAAAGSTYVVNSTIDEPDADAADGKCLSFPSLKCTLRAAVMQSDVAPGPSTILLPAGQYTLTRPGYDNNALIGDLDIGHDVTIQGVGSGTTIVDGNGAVTGDRVFKILDTAQNVTLSGMTIRGGQSLSSTVGVIGGGGIYMEGAGYLLLSDVILENNTGLNGGGLYANLSNQGGSVEMDNVILRANTVKAGGVGAGGGVYAYLPSSSSVVAVLDSQVYSNTADGTGGGFFVDGTDLAHWSIDHSQIYSNTAASGAGIGNFLPFSLSNSRVHNNRAAFDGGAIEAFSPLAITGSTLDANTAGRFGGGIFDLATGNSAIYNDFDNITQSTLSGNFAHYGGGIYHDGFISPNSLLTLTNSTLSGNGVFRPRGATGSADGGGIYVYAGQARLFNSTVANNRVQLGLFPNFYAGIGGGLYITATSVLTAENTIIAKNTRGNGLTISVQDDCFSSGTTGTLAYDLFTTTMNCFVTGPQGGNIVGQDPLLGPLQINGGTTQTQALMPGSPAIDTGAPAGCTGAAGAPIMTDQRGFPRPYGPACDIGAFEYNPNISMTFMPFLRK
jgi:CSLREA domain-containing protein